jgi:hypothetical protein
MSDYEAHDRIFAESSAAAQAALVEPMNLLAQDVVNNGSVCDRSVFYYAMFGRTPDDTGSHGPLVQPGEEAWQAVQRTESLQFAAGEPYIYSPDAQQPLNPDLIGMILPSTRDLASPVLEYRIGRGEGPAFYAGSIFMLSATVFNSGWRPVFRDNVLQSVLSLRRYAEGSSSTLPIVTTTPKVDNFTIGMLRIREGLRAQGAIRPIEYAEQRFAALQEYVALKRASQRTRLTVQTRSPQ